MPTDLRRTVLGTVVFPIALAVSARVSGQAPAVRWRTDWESARVEARRAGKPLLVVFRCER
ncbi:MAG: hypothetical protein ACKO5K_02410 [Armatimonadota bacterium]